MESWYTYRVQKDQISPQHRVYIADEVDKEIERLKKIIKLQKRLMACWRLQDHRKAVKVLTELEALKDK